MFEQRRGSSQQGVRGEMGRDGCMRMKETSQESVDVTDGRFQMGTIDVAIGGIGTPDTRRGSSQLYGMEEQEMSFSADNGGRNVYYLDDGGYRTEEWYTRGGRRPGQLRNEGFREIHVEHQPIYTEIQPDSEVSKNNSEEPLFPGLLVSLNYCASLSCQSAQKRRSTSASSK